MAIEKFWNSVRWSSNLLVPYNAEESPRLDPTRIETILRSETNWLTPGWMKGYDPAEFDFLSEEERTRLDEGVKEFKAVVDSIPKNAQATGEQLDKGVTGFRKILEVLRPDRYPDFEAFLLGKKIENFVRDEVPAWLTEMIFESGNDHGGEPALWIYAVLEDFALEDDVRRENARLIREIFGQAVAEICPERFPYVRFRSVSDQTPEGLASRR
jgi:hypothetical protein